MGQSLSSTCAHFSGAFKCETLENWGIWSFENPTPHWGLAITNMPLWQWLKVSKETGNFVPAKWAQVELSGWFGLEQFSSRDARTKEQASRASVYDWLNELSAAGAIELIELGRGSRPSIWQVSGLPQDHDVLPLESTLFGDRSA